jgi:DNA-3-methyladenine glycosylase
MRDIEDPVEETGPPGAEALNRSFFSRPVAIVAADLLGTWLLFDGVGGIIVETEAYDGEDPASHSARGPSKTNGSMFGPVGHAYVYRSYGIHWCLNVVCGSHPGGAVLIRAIEPRIGLARMKARRGALPSTLLCSGPGRLCAALGIDGSLDGHDLGRPPFAMLADHKPPASGIAIGPRIGITKAAEVPWRFCLAGSRFLSRPIGPTIEA